MNQARNAVAGVGSGYNAYIAEFLKTDANGKLDVPRDRDMFVLHLITSAPTHEWGKVRFRDVRVQVNAYSRVEGNALFMLNLAEPALVALAFIPFQIINLGRDGSYVGYAQDFERGTD